MHMSVSLIDSSLQNILLVLGFAIILIMNADDLECRAHSKFGIDFYPLYHQDTIAQYHRLPSHYLTILVNLGRQVLMTYLIHVQQNEDYEKKVSDIIYKCIVKSLREEQCKKMRGKWDRESFFQLLLPKVLGEFAEQNLTFVELRGKSRADSIDLKRLSSSSKPDEQEYKFGVIEVGSSYYLIGKIYDRVKGLFYFDRIINLDKNKQVKFQEILKEVEKEKVEQKNVDSIFRICFASKEIGKFSLCNQLVQYQGKVFKVNSQLFSSKNVYHSNFIYQLYEEFQQRMTLKRLVDASILRKLLQRFNEVTRKDFLKFIEDFVVKPANSKSITSKSNARKAMMIHS